MKTLILTTATIFFVGLTTFIQDVSGNTKNEDHKLDPKSGMKYLAFNSFVIGQSKNPSEELRYEVRGMYSRSIKKETLGEARVLSDIISDYPINWITSYVSVEILATSNGEFRTAISTNDTLTTEQRNILSNVDMSSEVTINVNYTYKVPVDNIIENNTMHVLMTVVPDVQAQYVGGYEKLINYLKEKTMPQFSGINPKKFNKVSIRFTVNEEGKVTDARTPHLSADSNSEKLLIDVINNMPAWKPAENAKGIKVKQEFEFIISGSNTDGC